MYDLIDDGLVALGSTPYKIEQAKAMVDNVVKALGGKALEYTFSTSGHSLGAIVSDITAVDIVARNLKFNISTTYDNPGSEKAVKYAIDNNLFTIK
jgi:hypothetical protein